MKIRNGHVFASEKERRGGFTLVEVVAAIFILTIALLGVASVTVMVVKGNSFSKSMTTATTLAKDKMEELRRTDFADIASGGPETVETIYQRGWTVTDTVLGGLVATKTIAVTVTWPWRGQNHTVTLNTIISR